MPAYFGPSNHKGRGFNPFRESLAPRYSRDTTRLYAGFGQNEQGQVSASVRTGGENPFSSVSGGASKPAQATDPNNAVRFEDLPSWAQENARKSGYGPGSTYTPRVTEDSDVANELRQAGVTGALGDYSERREGRYMVRQYGDHGIVYDTRTNQRRYVSNVNTGVPLSNYFEEGVTTGNPNRRS